MRGMLLAALATMGLHAQQPPACEQCDMWNRPQEPFKIYGNTYYVGVRGLSAVLITSPEGHVLIDAALPESADAIARNIGTLGFRVEDVKLILNSHVHFDHAGGIAALQRASGARVAASPWSAAVLRTGRSSADDPQHGVVPPIASVPRVQEVADGATLHVGGIAVTVHYTPGHTPGGTTWTWRSCESSRCLDVVYADSLTAVSADGFRFTAVAGRVQAFERTFTTVAALPCDILVTPHPEASDLFGRLEKRARGAADAMNDREACGRYARGGLERFRKRIADERAGAP